MVAIYAGTKGFLDDLAVDDVRAFETALVQDFRTNHADLLESVRTTKALPPTDQLDKAIAEVKKGFASTKPESPSAGPAEQPREWPSWGTADAPAPEAVTAGAAPEGEGVARCLQARSAPFGAASEASCRLRRSRGRWSS